MTIQNTTLRKAGPSQGNGVNSSFPFTFKVFATTDVLVTYLDPSSVQSALVLGSDYTVYLNSDQNAAPGGVITLLWTPATATYITLTSQVPNTQNLALTNSGGFYPQSINDALDRVVIQVQQLAEQLSRTFKISVSSIGSPGAYIGDYLAQASSSASAASAYALAASNSAASAAGTIISATEAAISQASAYALAASNSAASAAGTIISATEAAISQASAYAMAASNSVASISSLSSSCTSSKVSASLSATAAANSAISATTPTALALANYIDLFFPSSKTVTFASIYVSGGWDMGNISQATFTNESTSRCVNLASDATASFNFGTVP